MPATPQVKKWTIPAVVASLDLVALVEFTPQGLEDLYVSLHTATEAKSMVLASSWEIARSHSDRGGCGGPTVPHGIWEISGKEG